jgi:DNA processing protein
MSDVCPTCARRAWLLRKLSARLDFRVGGQSRFWGLLELPDLDLIEAIGGRRRAELHAAYAAWEPPNTQEDAGMDTMNICRHHPAYPRTIRKDPLAPHTLSVRGDLEHLASMFDEKVVAIVGTRRASDYGMETARELARGLAASGLVVASGLAEGIATAAHAGALEAQGTTVTVMVGAVERCTPAWCAPLYRRILERGCAVSESHRSRRTRLWWQPARTRTLALLAQLVIVVEADERPWELACAHLACSRGRHVAAVPGRVSSSSSRGTNALLMGGAKLIRDPQDALDVLYGVDRRAATERPESTPLDPGLAGVLDRVGRGEDTIEKLVRRGAESGEIAVALTELELHGMLVRGDGGRYVPTARAPAG